MELREQIDKKELFKLNAWELGFSVIEDDFSSMKNS